MKRLAHSREGQMLRRALLLASAWLIASSCKDGSRPRKATEDPICGNMVLETSSKVMEECEYDSDCPGEGDTCQDCRCVETSCGDGVLGDEEECEGDSDCPGDGTCQDCRCFETSCGDGVTSGEEQCEEDSDCPGSGDTCQGCECFEGACGDGVVSGDEECDPLTIESACQGDQTCSEACTCVGPTGQGGTGGASGSGGTGGQTAGAAGNGGISGSGGSGGGTVGCNTSFVGDVYFWDEATAEALLSSFGGVSPDYLQVWLPFGEVGPVALQLAAVTNTSSCNDEPCVFVYQDVASGVADVVFQCTDGSVELTENGAGPAAGATLTCDKFEPVSIDNSGNVTILTTPTCRKIGPVTMGGCELFDTLNSFTLHDAPIDMAALDLNDDGFNDIAVVGSDQIVVHFGSAPGTFSFGTPYQVAVPSQGWLRPQRVAVLDLNDDAILDLVVAGAPSNGTPTSLIQIGVVLGNATTGSIVAGPAIATTAYAAEQLVVGLSTEDLDGDSDPDVAVATQAQVSSPDHVVVYLNNAGTLAAPVELDIQPNSGVVAMIPAAVTPGTGLDLITLNRDAGNLAVFPGTSGVYNYLQLFTSNVPNGATAFDLIDLNGNAVPDLSVAFQPNPGTPSVRLYTGSDAGTFSFTQTAFEGVPCDSVAVADFNADGKPDFACGTRVGPQVVTRLDDGASKFFSSAPTFLPDGGGVRITVADVNGDGKPDLLQSNGEEALVLQHRGQSCP